MAVNTFLVVLIVALVIGNALLSAAKPKKKPEWVEAKAAGASTQPAKPGEVYFNAAAALEQQVESISRLQSELSGRVDSLEMKLLRLQRPGSPVLGNTVSMQNETVKADDDEEELRRKINELVYHAGESG